MGKLNEVFFCARSGHWLFRQLPVQYVRLPSILIFSFFFHQTLHHNNLVNFFSHSSTRSINLKFNQKKKLPFTSNQGCANGNVNRNDTEEKKSWKIRNKSKNVCVHCTSFIQALWWGCESYFSHFFIRRIPISWKVEKLDFSSSQLHVKSTAIAWERNLICELASPLWFEHIVCWLTKCQARQSVGGCNQCKFRLQRVCDPNGWETLCNQGVSLEPSRRMSSCLDSLPPSQSVRTAYPLSLPTSKWK